MKRMADGIQDQHQSARKTGVDEARAAALLGLTREQLLQLSQECGLRPVAAGQFSGDRLFTYEDLHRMCRLVLGVQA